MKLHANANTCRCCCHRPAAHKLPVVHKLFTHVYIKQVSVNVISFLTVFISKRRFRGAEQTEARDRKQLYGC